MKKVLMLLVAVGAVCAAGSVEAKKAVTKQAPAPRLFADLDVNADGQVAKEEFVTAVQKAGQTIQTALFIKLDSDKDDFLTEKEYAAGSKPAAKGKAKAKK
jgi:Ca2+-binding EF-hand superfamily protein